MSTPPGDRAAEAARRAELAASHERGEALVAQRMIDDFLVRIAEAGIAPVALQARLLGSGRPVRTDAQGWYLKNDRSIAVGTGGEYYVLVVPGGWSERVRGVRLKPSLPPLVVSRGGRDGESGDLQFFLDKVVGGG